MGANIYVIIFQRDFPMPSLQSIICLRVALDAVHLSLHRFTKLNSRQIYRHLLKRLAA
uniref:Uncharacterized protein n=2 Tax=Anguilla anguilla TaxID=7936 RepID=A0A0E9VJ80_ANGAN